MIFSKNFLIDKKILGIVISILSVFMGIFSSYESNLRYEIIENNIYLDDLYTYYQGKKNREYQLLIAGGMVEILKNSDAHEKFLKTVKNPPQLSANQWSGNSVGIEKLSSLNLDSIYKIALAAEEKKIILLREVKLFDISKILLQIGIFLFSIVVTSGSLLISIFAFSSSAVSLFLFSYTYFNI